MGFIPKNVRYSSRFCSLHISSCLRLRTLYEKTNFHGLGSHSKCCENSRAAAGIGRYLETRPFYTTDSFVSHRNQGPEWRTVHLGLDVFMDAESVIYAPVDGTVFSLENNDEIGDYGPTIILEHKVNKDLIFWTLYGHLTQDSIDNLSINQTIKKGEPLCKMGNYPINGNWPPHLHFQVILDRFDHTGNYPGVAYFSEKEIWESICPNPNIHADGRCDEWADIPFRGKRGERRHPKIPPKPPCQKPQYFLQKTLTHGAWKRSIPLRHHRQTLPRYREQRGACRTRTPTSSRSCQATNRCSQYQYTLLT